MKCCKALLAVDFGDDFELYICFIHMKIEKFDNGKPE
jgi:hypothetical protein